MRLRRIVLSRIRTRSPIRQCARQEGDSAPLHLAHRSGVSGEKHARCAGKNFKSSSSNGIATSSRLSKTQSGRRTANALRWVFFQLRYSRSRHTRATCSSPLRSARGATSLRRPLGNAETDVRSVQNFHQTVWRGIWHVQRGKYLAESTRRTTSFDSGRRMIPPFNLSGVLPPYTGTSPAIPAGLSPYDTSMKELAEALVTSADRAAILRGFIALRAKLLALGLQSRSSSCKPIGTPGGTSLRTEPHRFNARITSLCVTIPASRRSASTTGRWWWPASA